MTQSYERISILEQMLADIDALPQGDQFWLVERLMQKMRSRTISEFSVQDTIENSSENPLEYVDGILAVKSQGIKLSNDLVTEMREDRMGEIGGWGESTTQISSASLMLSRDHTRRFLEDDKNFI